MEWQVAMRPGRRRMLDPGSEEALTEKAKASVRAKVEHPFLRIKGLFGYGKVRYRGLMKNTQRLALLFGLGNLLTAESQLRAWCARRQARPARRAAHRPDVPCRGETPWAECSPVSPRLAHSSTYRHVGHERGKNSPCSEHF